MRCNDFDAHIDEMLSGILHPDANRHMQQCERCTSHYRARAVVQTGLIKLASASVQGPSPATDRAVMDAYRQWQQRRGGPQQPLSEPQPAARLLTFPSRGAAPVSPLLSSRYWWSGAAAAAVVLAVLGSGLHLRNGVRTVSAPTVATAPVPSTPLNDAASGPVTQAPLTARLVVRHSPLRTSQSSQSSMSSMSHSGSQSAAAQVDATSPEVASAAVNFAPAVAAKAGSGSAPQPQANVSPLIHLASSEAASGTAGGAAGNMAQSAGSTWPGYSNLMYCDPVVCSGPMQVVHIKVPAGQVKPNAGESVGNGFVNADVVVGPDGVARAIRVAN